MPRGQLIQLRAGTAAAWTSANPTLAAGEPGFETDTGREKRGPAGGGSWNSLPYTTDLSRLPTKVQARASQRRKNRYGAAVNATPTVTISTTCTYSGNFVTAANASTGVVNAQDTPFRYEGANLHAPYGNQFVAPYFLSAVQPVPYRISFDFYGTGFSAQLFGGGYEVLIWVNDQPLTAASSTLANDSNTYWANVNLKTIGHYRITLELSGGAYPSSSTNYFGGVAAAATADIRPPTDANPLRLLVLGDSYGCGKGAGNNSATPNANSVYGYVPLLSQLLGIPDTWSMSVGGTGYVANNSGASTAYSGRIADIVAAAPDAVLIQGSINDGGMAGIQAAAQSLISTLQADLPLAKIITTGPLFAGAYSGNYTTAAAAIQAAATAQAVPFINASGWSSGTGYYGATNGSGPSDYYLNGDAVHPTAGGHQMIANRLAYALEPMLNLAV